jgi:flagellar hook-associated protein 1 FlgK
LGHARQRSQDLGVVETQFDLTSQFGIASGLNQFFNSFSQLAVNPNDSVARQGVLDQAGQVATSFNQAAVGLQNVSVNIDRQTQDTVSAINRLAEQIAGLNHVYRATAGASTDAGLEAQLNAALEELSGLVNYSLVRTPDGAANVYLGGQTILVIGDRLRPVSADLSTPQTVLLDVTNNDITGQLTGGRIGALIQEKNVTIPGYLAQLNTLAQSFADSVNTTLAQGVGRDGLPPPADLFLYSAAGAAGSIEANGLTPDQIAAAYATAPSGNGNAIAVAQLGSQPLAGGFTFTQAFGNLGAQVGRDMAVARNDRNQYSDTLAQARQFRQEQTGVSLDEQAALLLQCQQNYQAITKLITIVDDMTESVLNMIR